MRKITGEMIIDKLKELPESDQQTILDFIEYLLEKQEQKQDKKSVDKKKQWVSESVRWLGDAVVNSFSLQDV